jgi:membrane protease YdiL (CAAX protease family)
VCSRVPRIRAPRLEFTSANAPRFAPWLVLALGSALPAIAWSQLLDEPPPLWLHGAQALVLTAVFLLIGRLNGLRSLRGFVVALAAMQLGLVVATFIRQLPAYDEWARDAPDYQEVFVSAFVLLIPGLLMVLVALADGLGLRELFLRRGDVAAPSRIPWTSRRTSWRRLGPFFVVVFAVPLAVYLISSNEPDVDRLDDALALLPVALVFGAVNALSEEVRFRCVLLARLVPVVGAESSLWMTALLFGLAHWYGANPSGPTGVVMTMLFGLVLAKSMIETSGLFWAWTMHAAAGVLIFTVLVMAAP